MFFLKKKYCSKMIEFGRIFNLKMCFQFYLARSFLYYANKKPSQPSYARSVFVLLPALLPLHYFTGLVFYFIFFSFSVFYFVNCSIYIFLFILTIISIFSMQLLDFKSFFFFLFASFILNMCTFIY